MVEFFAIKCIQLIPLQIDVIVMHFLMTSKNPINTFFVIANGSAAPGIFTLKYLQFF